MDSECGRSDERRRVRAEPRRRRRGGAPCRVVLEIEDQLVERQRTGNVERQAHDAVGLHRSPNDLDDGQRKIGR
jgi:hypothetical protein